jgi:hypothetical protein
MKQVVTATLSGMVIAGLVAVFVLWPPENLLSPPRKPNPRPIVTGTVVDTILVFDFDTWELMTVGVYVTPGGDTLNAVLDVVEAPNKPRGRK